MKAAIYARVSTSDQHNEIQIKELTAYVERRGWELAGVYQDQMSGAKAQRPGLDALMADARLHKFDAVIVWKLDRFGRSLINCVAGIQELTAAGVRFIAVSQGLDTDAANPTSRLLLHILAALAEFERELIKERGVGRAQAREDQGRRGLTTGSPRCLLLLRFCCKQREPTDDGVRVAGSYAAMPKIVWINWRCAIASPLATQRT